MKPEIIYFSFFYLLLSPSLYSDVLPEKISSFSRGIYSHFDQKKIDSKEFIFIKDQVRKKIIENSILSQKMEDPSFNIYEGLDPQNQLSLFFLNKENLVTTLEEMDLLQLNKKAVAVQPWSDDYWPIYSGELGKRYADPSFPTGTHWLKNFEYFQKNSFFKIFQSKDEKNILALSPSEKYDLLFGFEDSDSLTKKMWLEGKSYFDREGDVEAWMGLCHGWAAAAFMFPRPKNKIEVLAFDRKTKLTFFPSDIKGLGTLLWATGRTNVRFVGGRCNKKEPKRDENGRLIDSECFDLNPALWHLVLVNQIGQFQKSFVMDATFDYEVWNQPVVSYEYYYFNPVTGEKVSTLSEAQIQKEDYTTDPFRRYRDAKTKTIVGIQIKVQYLSESAPSHKITDSKENDHLIFVNYKYDLELDSHGEVIGGEWYTSAHPDFLWSPVAGSKVTTWGDLMLGEEQWDGARPLDKRWKESALSSLSHKQPLSKVVEILFEKSAEQK